MTDAIAHRARNLDWDDTSSLRKTHTSGRVIDFILLNAPAVGELVIDSGFVLGSSHPEYDWRNDPIPAGYSSDHCAIAVDLIPKEGKGSEAQGLHWPSTLTVTSLRNTPEESTFTSSTPPSSGDSNTASPDTAPFLASKRSKVFHDSSCGNASRISDSNKVGYPTFQDAQNAGKRPANCCKPTE
jgi:hypothetical protein